MREVARREADNQRVVTDEAWMHAWTSARCGGDPGGSRSNEKRVPAAAFGRSMASREVGECEEEGQPQAASEVLVEVGCRQYNSWQEHSRTRGQEPACSSLFTRTLISRDRDGCCNQCELTSRPRDVQVSGYIDGFLIWPGQTSPSLRRLPAAHSSEGNLLCHAV